MYRVRPRRAQYDRFWARQQASLERRGPGVVSRRHVRPQDPVWQDYYPFVPGSAAEKMVFSELARRGVSFFFGPYWGDMPFTEQSYERYRPDFVLPEYRIVLEVYGTYWHTRPGDTERDAQKAIKYEASGYKYVNLWAWEIYAGVREAIDRNIPELVNPLIQTGRIFLSDRPMRPLAALISRLQSQPKVIRKRISWAGEGRRRVKPLFEVEPKLRYPKKERPPREAGFQALAAEHLKKLHAYALEWKGYVERLGEFFEKHPSAARRHRRQYRYWQRWKTWWGKWQRALEAPPEWWDYVMSLEEYFERYPEARGIYREEYYRWLRWRRAGYRRL